MPTNDRKVNLYEKRLLSLTATREEFLEYLEGAIDEVGSSFFAGASGTLDNEVIGLNNAHGGSTFDIDTTNAEKVLAGNHTIDLTVITGAGITDTIPFENTGAATYYVGVFHAEVEIGIEINSATSDPEYTSLKQSFGTVDNPDSVTDGGSYIRLVINSITEAGVDHSGRSVRVWLVDPVSPSESIAFFTGTSVYSGGNNYVDIPYSGASGPLGQDTSSAPPSTNAIDYKVFIEGVSWKKNTDLRTVQDCAFLGLITGGTPPTFNTNDQPLLQIVSLDRAYDGIPGPGLGRKIYVDSGAVELVTTNAATPATGDDRNAQLFLDRKGCTDWMQIHYGALTGDVSGVPMALFAPEESWGGLSSPESGTKVGAGGVINFSGTAFDQMRGDDLKRHYLAWVANGTLAERGLYYIDAYTAASLTLKRMDGSVPTFTATEVCDVYIIFPRFLVANSNPIQGTSAEWLEGILMVLRDVLGQPTPFNVLLEGATLTLWDYGLSTALTTPRRQLLEVDPTVIGQANKYPFAFRRGMVVRGGNVSGGAGEESPYNRDGVRIWDAGGGVDDRDPMFPFAVDRGFPEDVPTFHTNPAFAVDVYGGVMRGHFFRDDFFYESSRWTGPSTAPVHYECLTGGAASTVRARDAADGGVRAEKGHGVIELVTDTTIGDYAWINAPHSLVLDTDKDFRWTFRARLKLMATEDTEVILGLRSGGAGGNRYFYFWHDPITPYGWYLNYWDGSTNQSVSCSVAATVGKYQWFEIHLGSTSMFWNIYQKDNAASSGNSGSIGYGTLLAGTTDVAAPICSVETNGGARNVYLDMWEWFDTEILYGRLGNSHNMNHP